MDYLNTCDELINHPDPFRMNVEEANSLRLASLQGSFEHHYKNNAVYKAFCDKFGVKPDDIQAFDDILKIAFITSDIFKQVSAYKEKEMVFMEGSETFSFSSVFSFVAFFARPRY